MLGIDRVKVMGQLFQTTEDNERDDLEILKRKSMVQNFLLSYYAGMIQDKYLLNQPRN